MTLLAALVGYAIGALPTADGIGRLWGVRLRSEGSRNPGANNARRLGGIGLAAVILLLEISKGLLAVVIGVTMADESGAVAGALGAVGGNVYNVWYRFAGGKGLAISAGALIGIWPTVLIPVLAILVVVVKMTGSSGAATVVAILALALFAVAWWLLDLTTAWGIDTGPLLLAAAGGLGLILWRRHVAEAHFSRPDPDSPPGES